MTKLIVFICLFALDNAVCRAQQQVSPLFEKFGWKRESANNSIKKVAATGLKVDFLVEWEKTLDFEYYRQTVPDRFAKIMGAAQFKWAVYVDQYFSGHFGRIMGGRFIGETADGRLLVLLKEFRQDTHAALLPPTEWTKMDRLKGLEKIAGLKWDPSLDLQLAKNSPPEFEEALAVQCISNGVRGEVFAATLGGGDKLGEAQKAQIEAIRALQAAFNVVTPEIGIPLRLSQ